MQKLILMPAPCSTDKFRLFYNETALRYVCAILHALRTIGSQSMVKQGSLQGNMHLLTYIHDTSSEYAFQISPLHGVPKSDVSPRPS
jgi:hypothetical protein